MMRELDTISPVVWPSWCYSVEGHDSEEKKEVAHPPAQLVASKPRGKRRSNNTATTNALMAVRYQRETNGDVKPADVAKDDKLDRDGAIKAERLSPGSTVAGLADQNSNSSRSCTPSSSYPSTPPDAPSHLKQMEQMMMARNYSDFMRSLAAKYNHANPNDYFSSPRNGFPQSLDPRFSAFKTGATPFVGLMAPLAGATPAVPSVSPASQPSTTSDVIKSKPDLFGANGLNPFASPSLNPLFSPIIDMSSTQALLNIVRTANAQNSDGVLFKGALKRTNETSPLDLSSGAPVVKKVKRESIYSAESFLNFPLMDAIRTKGKPLKRNCSASAPARFSPVSSGNVSGAAGCTSSGASACEGDQQSIAHWTVDDVCSFLTGIDICAEYEKNFRDERIDGSSLPLLTEEHLTNSLGMKLGPALKLRAALARRLGHCSICLHCVHCHSARTPTPTPTPVPAPNSRPSSAGN